MLLKDKTMNKFTSDLRFIIFGIGLTITLSIAATAIIGSTSAVASASAIVAGATNIHNIQVKVGGGNVSYPFFGYDPQKIEINVGDSVTWTGNPKWRSLIQ